MTVKKINIAIMGATGYVGIDLTYLLSKHPKANLKYLIAKKKIGKNINYFDKRIKKTLPNISKFTKVNWNVVDIVFLCLPNGEAQSTINKLISYQNLKFIDLSGDFRLENSKTFLDWYKIKHKAPKHIKDSIYSISEFVKKDISKFRIISNPGCYPTSIQLALVPLLKKKYIKFKNIIIDSKSGYSGAGKNYKNKFAYKNFYEAISTYGIYKHKHMAELDQEFFKVNNKKIDYIFNPHLLPTFRGILSSIYVELNNNIKIETIYKILKDFHKKNIFIKIKKINETINTGNVINTNNCEISVCKTRFKNKFVIFSVIDNLIKGASGQAIQNMNLIYKFNERLGLQ